MTNSRPTEGTNEQFYKDVAACGISLGVVGILCFAASLAMSRCGLLDTPSAVRQPVPVGAYVLSAEIFECIEEDVRFDECTAYAKIDR